MNTASFSNPNAPKPLCRRTFLRTGALLACVVSMVCSGFPESPAVRAGLWEIRLRKLGPYVTWGGRPIVTGGYVRLYRPQYRGSLLHTFKARRPECRAQQSSDGGTITWQARHREYTMTYALRLQPPYITVSLDAVVNRESALGGIEFAAFCLPPWLISGGKGRSLHGKTWTAFEIPDAPSNNWTINGAPARVIELETKTGTWRFEDLQGERLRLSDMRRNPNYRQTLPFFWIFPAVSVPPVRHIRAAVRMTFKPSPDFLPFSKLPVLEFAESARSKMTPPVSAPVPLFPPPKDIRYTGGEFRCPRPLTIGPVSRASATDLRGILERLAAGLQSAGVSTRLLNDGTAEVRLGTGRVPAPGGGGGKDHPTPEAYELVVDHNGVRITGSDFPGLEYGVATLLQLLQRRKMGAVIPHCRVLDWPVLSQRAVHPPRLWPHSHLGYFRRYFDILSQARFNMIVWEISGSVRFPEQPWAWSEKGSFAPEEIRSIIGEVRARHVRMIPELECLGHVREWLGTDPGDFDRYPWLRNCFENRQRTDLCVSNPRTIEVVRQAVDAISGLFGDPPFFHVGLDESWKFATCPRCARRNPADLLADWLQKLYEHLEQRHQTMMMWHDMLLEKRRIPGAVANGDRTAPAIDRIPKDIVICNWQYHPGPALPSTRYFLEKGFRDVLVCPWYDPDDVFDCARAAQTLHVGILSTNWNAFIRREPMPSFAAAAGRDLVGSLLAAEYAWAGTQRKDGVLSSVLPFRDLNADERTDAGIMFQVVDFGHCPPCPSFPVSPPAYRATGGWSVVDSVPFLPAPTEPVKHWEEKRGGDSSGSVGRGVRGIPADADVLDVFVLAGLLERPVVPEVGFKVVFHYAGDSQAEVDLGRGLVRMGPFFRRIGLGFHGKWGGFPGSRRYFVFQVRNPQPERKTTTIDVLQTSGNPAGLVVRGLSMTIRP